MRTASIVKGGNAEVVSRRNREDDTTFRIPRFRSRAEAKAWWENLPKEEIEIDARLMTTVKTSIRMNRRTIDGFTYLANQKKVGSGQTLMKLVLGAYLAKHLPPDF